MTARKKTTQSDTVNISAFEKSLTELEGLVEQLEKGDLSLEDALKQFERGVQLARGCQEALKAAELKVRELVDQNGDEVLRDFEDSPQTHDE